MSIDNRPEASGSGLSGKTQAWIITRRGWQEDFVCEHDQIGLWGASCPLFDCPGPYKHVIVSDGKTAYEAWLNASGIIFRCFGESVPFNSLHVETPTAYRKRLGREDVHGTSFLEPPDYQMCGAEYPNTLGPTETMYRRYSAIVSSGSYYCHLPTNHEGSHRHLRNPRNHSEGYFCQWPRD